MNINEIYSHITLEECARLIASVGRSRSVLVRGEKGIGKSTILTALAKYPELKDHWFAYMDMQTKDFGDLMLPKFRNIDGVDVSSFIPNEEFGLHAGRPIVLMLDELTKATNSVKNVCLPILQERRVGTFRLPEGSIVFGTGNLDVEGIGDGLQSHAANRMIQVTVTKPDAEAWINNFAIDNNIHPAVVATVKQFPNMLGSFTDYPNPRDNNYIFHPKEPRASFVTPRSLHAASDLLYAMSNADRNVLAHCLSGTIGKAATLDMMAIVGLHDKLPTWEEVTKAPTKAKVPTDAAASVLLVYSAVQQVTTSTIKAWLTYQERLRVEAQALFATTVLATSKAGIVGSNKDFVVWVQKNNYLFGA